MPDVNLDSRFDWGAIRTGFEEMRAMGAQTASNISRDISGMFAGTIAVTGIVAAFKSVIDQAADIHREAARFQIDAEQLQTIGNAAKEINLPMDLVARAMNQVEINAYKAAQGSAEQADALQRLGIDAQEFYSLKGDEKMLALADAFKNASDRGSAYEAVATLIGKRSTELIPLLEQGADAIREQGAAMAKFSDDTVERLNRVHTQLEQFRQTVSVNLGTALVIVIDAWQKGWYAIASIVIAAVDICIGNFQALWKALHFDFSGAIEAWKEWANAAKEQIKSVNDYAEENQPKPPGPPGTPREEPGPAGPRAGGGGAGIDEEIKLEEKLAKLRRDAAFEQLSDQGKLEGLERELYALHLKGMDLSKSQEEHTKALIAEEEKRKELTDQQNKMQQDAANYAEKEAKLRQDMSDAADKELADSKEATKEIQLRAMGRKDLAERARMEYEFDNKIKDAKKVVAEAEKEGFNDVAATNRALVAQLTLEKDTALAAHDKAVAEEKAAKAAEEKAKVESEQNTLEQLKEQNVLLDMKLAGQEEAAKYTQIEYEFRGKINEALGQAADLWYQAAKAYSDGNNALAEQYSKEAQIKDQEAEQLAIEKQKTTQLEMQNEELKTQESIGGGGAGVGALGEAGKVVGGFGTSPFSFPQLIEATDVRTGRVDPAKLSSILLQGMIDALKFQTSGTQQIYPGGPGSAVDWFTSLQQQQKGIALAALQEKQQRQDMLDLLAYYESLAAGRPDFSFITRQFFGYGRLPAGTPLLPGGLTFPSGPMTIPQLTEQLTVLQQQLTALQAIAQNTSPVKI